MTSLCFLAATLALVAVDDDLEFFEREVRPILVERCQSCHGPDKAKGGLRLDSRAALLEGGDSGPSAVVGNSEESLIIEAIGYEGDIKMPPRSKLAANEIDVLRRWVERGLPWTKTNTDSTARPGDFDLATRKAEHWSWQPVRPVTPPDVNDPAWPIDPIDQFILAKLDEAGLKPAPDADRRSWLRRVTFDLIGLPPTAGEIAGFERDGSADAQARVVDRLLASPEFGERWARHWLDLVRFAETRGHEVDPIIPNAYQYRDYLIRALNNDVSYDRIIREHIAGDLLETPRINPQHGFDESILGTGFWFLGEEVHSPVDIRQDETDRIDNRLDVFGKTFLGLTIACARCHDHKFDAISQRDYSSIAGFLISGGYRQARFETIDAERRAALEIDSLRDEARSRLLPRMARSRRPTLDRVADILMACRDLLQAAAPARPDAERGPLVAESARRHGLDPALLDRWLPEVVAARDNPRHPLHTFARIAAEPDEHDPERSATHRKRLLDEIEARLRTAEQAPAGRLIADLGSPPPAWRSDGPAFRTQSTGTIRLGGVPDHPTIEVLDRAAVYRDPIWDRPRNAPDNQRDHGRLGEWDRPGQTVRTPEFSLTTGRLWYLIRGSVRAYAAVNSHLIIAGPLHGGLLAEWGHDDRWRWVQHNLTDYAGHRLHVELSPAGTGPSAVALVVEADSPPPLPESIDPINQTILVDVDSIDTIARRVASLLEDASERLGRGTLDDPATATIARWITANPQLFPTIDRETDTELADLVRRQAALIAALPTESHTAPAMIDGNGVDEFFLIRGGSKLPTHLVPRRFLEAIAGPEPMSLDPNTSGRRELAEAVASPDNPFTARVMVNRVWHHLFGRGIVASVDNLGVLGDRPTHPELLDHLADRFVRDGWSLKKLIRTITLSRTYRMSSRPDESADTADPDDLLLHRMRVRRLQGEAIRDALLAISGRLDRTQGGPSVPVHLTSFMQGRGRPGQSGPADGNGRRSIYLELRRNFLPPFLLAFDTPIPFNTMGRRNISNVPAQALILLNDPFVHDQAAIWARRVLAVPEQSAEQRIISMYISAFSREPSSTETAQAMVFLTDLGGSESAWTDLAHVLINSKEFLFLP